MNSMVAVSAPSLRSCLRYTPLPACVTWATLTLRDHASPLLHAETPRSGSNELNAIQSLSPANHVPGLNEIQTAAPPNHVRVKGVNLSPCVHSTRFIQALPGSLEPFPLRPHAPSFVHARAAALTNRASPLLLSYARFASLRSSSASASSLDCTVVTPTLASNAPCSLKSRLFGAPCWLTSRLSGRHYRRSVENRAAFWCIAGTQLVHPGVDKSKLAGTQLVCPGVQLFDLLQRGVDNLKLAGTRQVYPRWHSGWSSEKVSSLGCAMHSSAASHSASASAEAKADEGAAAAAAAFVEGRVSPESIRMSSDGILRLATFQPPGLERPTVGAVKNSWIRPLRDCVAAEVVPKFAYVDFDDMTSVIRHWDSVQPLLQLDLGGMEPVPLEQAKLLAPIPRPAGPIMFIGKNYAEHVKEVDTWKTAPNITAPSIPQHPIVFTKAPQAVVGPGAAILLPPPHVSSKVDYEAELAVVIGKEGRGISEECAMDHVFGYTILNDVTARDVQKLHQQWFLGKSCDTFCPMGPWIVPAGNVNGQDLEIQCWINNELRQNGRSSHMIFPIPVLIATISKAMTLRPGDVIATGTPSGVGSGFNPPKLLKAGDSVRMRIENIGELSNHVATY